jgi:hypothetical protein
MALSILAALCLLGPARADTVTAGHVRVDFSGEIQPHVLPRHGDQPIAVTVRGKVKPLAGSRPPALQRFVVAFNRHAHLFTRGLPVCPRRRLLAATSRQAREACGRALVGSGHFTAHIDIPESAPFPASGRALVFNSSLHGRPALVIHIYGRRPVPTSQVLPLTISHSRRPGLDITLAATMPVVGEGWGYVTAFDLTLHRTYAYRGKRRSLVSASCPAPAGFDRVPFRLAQGSFYLADGSAPRRTLEATCRIGPE